MAVQAQWAQLIEENELAYFRAGVCLGSPESYSLEEKAGICSDMEETSARIDAAMKEDFEAMPPRMQARMLDMLCERDPGMARWWKELLVGKVPDCVDEVTR